MIDLSMTFDMMKEEIGFSHYVFNKIISPEKNPEYFCDGFNGYKRFNSLFWNSVPDGPFKESFGELQDNSFRHGNLNDSLKSFYVRVALGDLGIAGQIIDEGKGFDYRKIISLKESGKVYYQNEGVGFLLFSLPGTVTVSYEKKGNISNMMYKFPKGE